MSSATSLASPPRTPLLRRWRSATMTQSQNSFLNCTNGSTQIKSHPLGVQHFTKPIQNLQSKSIWGLLQQSDARDNIRLRGSPVSVGCKYSWIVWFLNFLSPKCIQPNCRCIPLFFSELWISEVGACRVPRSNLAVGHCQLVERFEWRYQHLMICNKDVFRRFESRKSFVCDHIDSLRCINSSTNLCSPKRGIKIWWES